MHPCKHWNQLSRGHFTHGLRGPHSSYHSLRDPARWWKLTSFSVTGKWVWILFFQRFKNKSFTCPQCKKQKTKQNKSILDFSKFLSKAEAHCCSIGSLLSPAPGTLSVSSQVLWAYHGADHITVSSRTTGVALQLLSPYFGHSTPQTDLKIWKGRKQQIWKFAGQGHGPTPLLGEFISVFSAWSWASCLFPTWLQ